MNDLQISNNSMELTNDGVRAIQEVQGSIILAKKFPRDQLAAINSIMTACKRKRLAEGAMYAYPKGKTLVTGPSIRLAEVMAQCWGNISFGIRELEQREGESLVEAFCWDMQTNVRQSKVFTVKHEIKVKGEIKKLTDPREIYEIVANNGSRRLRACIIGIIPQDVTEDAIEACNKTLSGNSKEPIIDRVKKMIAAFGDIGVNKEMIEERLGHSVNDMIESQLIDYLKIYMSIKDGMFKREEFFNIPKVAEKSDLNEKFNTKKEENKNE